MLSLKDICNFTRCLLQSGRFVALTTTFFVINLCKNNLVCTLSIFSMFRSNKYSAVTAEQVDSYWESVAVRE